MGVAGQTTDDSTSEMAAARHVPSTPSPLHSSSPLLTRTNAKKNRDLLRSSSATSSSLSSLSASSPQNNPPQVDPPSSAVTARSTSQLAAAPASGRGPAVASSAVVESSHGGASNGGLIRSADGGNRTSDAAPGEGIEGGISERAERSEGEGSL